MMKKLSNAGFGLVEILIAVGISGGLALTLAKLMDNTSQSTKQIEAKAESINLKGMMQSTLSDSTACGYTFTPVITSSNLSTLSSSPNNSVTVPGVRDKINTVKFSTASNNLLPLTIVAMNLTNYSAATGTGDLVVNTTFKRNSSTTQEIKPIRITLNFSIDNSNPSAPVLKGCSPMAIGREWLLGGNSGTDENADYIGTSDNTPLILRVNAQRAGKIDSAGQVFLGYLAGASNTTGTNNTAIGHTALTANTSGRFNVAVGKEALLSNTTGQVNSAIGYQALRSNTTGNHNIALGYDTMYSNTTGTGNTAIGTMVLQYNTTGNDNAALGFAALIRNTTGGQNTAMGIRAATNNIASTHNTAFGYESLMANQTGAENTAIGANSLGNTNGGSNNTALGRYAGAYNTTGSNNVFIGYQAGSWAANSTGSRNIFLGANAGNGVAGVTTASDKLYIGNGVGSSLIEGDFSAAGRLFKVTAPATFGNNTMASNQIGSMAVGDGNSVTAALAFASGQGNTVSSWSGGAIGQTNNVSGSKSMGIGWNNVIPGQNAFVVGANNQATADYSFVFGIDSIASHSGSMVLSDYGSVGAASWGSDTFAARFQGGYRLYTSYSGTTVGVSLASGGTSWASLSDRNSKENFKEIDLEEHLRKIAKLPVTKWNYIGSDVPHMGPMAQDFYYIFRLGDGNDKVITTQDIEGVTIVAVKALEKRTRELQKENDDLKKRLEKLEAMMVKMSEGKK